MSRHEVQREIVAHNSILAIPRPLKLEPLVDSSHDLDNLVKEFQDVFQDPPKGLPPWRGIEHQIDLIPDLPYQIVRPIEPIQVKPRKFANK